MRVSRLLLLGASAAMLGACNEDDVVTSAAPPLAYVRFINAVPDTGPVTFKMIDQIEYSVTGALAMRFRDGTAYEGVEAKARDMRVFPHDSSATGRFYVDTTFTFEANTHYTAMLIGSAREGTMRLLFMTDPVQPPADGQIAIRAVHAGAAPEPVDAYVSAAPDTAVIGAVPVFTNVAPLTASAYVSVAPAALKTWVTPAGTQTVLASTVAPLGGVPVAGANPVAGSTVAGSALSAYVFPASATGSFAPQTAAYRAPAVVFFVDRIPLAPAQ